MSPKVQVVVALALFGGMGGMAMSLTQDEPTSPKIAIKPQKALMRREQEPNEHVASKTDNSVGLTPMGEVVPQKALMRGEPEPNDHVASKTDNIVVLTPMGEGINNSHQVLTPPAALQLGTAAGVRERMLEGTDGGVAEALRKALADLVSDIKYQTRSFESTLYNIRRNTEKKRVSRAKWKKAEKKRPKANKKNKAKVKMFRDDYSRYNKKIREGSHLYRDQKAKFNQLVAARDAMQRAVEDAEDLEQSITSLTQQISLKENLKGNTEIAHEAARVTAKREGDDMVQYYTDIIAKLTKSINTAQEEYDCLTEESCVAFYAANDKASLLEARRDEVHPLVEKWQKAKDAIQKIITAQKADLKKTQANLESTTADAEAEIDKLEKSLSASIADLTDKRTRAEEDRTKEIAKHAEIMKLMRSSQAVDISKLVKDISQLKHEKKDAQDRLNDLKNEYLSE